MKRIIIKLTFVITASIIFAACEASNGHDAVYEEEVATSEEGYNEEMAATLESSYELVSEVEPEPEPEVEPEPVPKPATPFIALAAGASSSFGLEEDGKLWAWGGAAGLGHPMGINRVPGQPTQMPLPFLFM